MVVRMWQVNHSFNSGLRADVDLYEVSEDEADVLTLSSLYRLPIAIPGVPGEIVIDHVEWRSEHVETFGGQPVVLTRTFRVSGLYYPR